MTNAYLAYIYHEQLDQIIGSGSSEVLNEIEIEYCEVFDENDSFYAEELANNGLTLQQALKELLQQKFSRTMPDDCYQYSNAFALLCQHFCRKLPTLISPFNDPTSLSAICLYYTASFALCRAAAVCCRSLQIDRC